MSIIHLTDSRFETEVLQSEGLALVDFWAPWCAPCRMISSILEHLAQEYGQRLKVFKVNIDENQGVATSYQVLSIPTLLFFKGGKVISQITGARSATDIKKTVDSLL